MSRWLRALEKAAELTDSKTTMTNSIKNDELDEETVSQLSGMFDKWEPGLDVEVGDVLRWDDTLVEVRQAHTTQSDWTPNRTPALWKVHRSDDYDDFIWVPGIDVEVGETFEYEGDYYTVVQAHTTQADWAPDSAPALWELVESEEPSDPEEPEPEPEAEEPDPEPENEGYPAWEPWDGNNENLYQTGDRVTHNGSNWEATTGNNHWEPGEFGWQEI